MNMYVDLLHLTFNMFAFKSFEFQTVYTPLNNKTKI